MLRSLRRGRGSAGLLVEQAVDAALDIGDRARDAVGIEDHDDGTVAKDGGARVLGHGAETLRQRLDDDFLGVEYFVDDQAKAQFADLHDDDAGAAVAAVFVDHDVEAVGESDERQQVVAQAQDARRIDELDLVLEALAGADQFEDGELRQGEAVILNADDERRDDGESQRDLDDEGRPMAVARAQVDRAADELDIGLHHVHADAAA